MAMCGTFGNYAIVPEMSLVKIDDDVDLRFAALIGCGVLTGVGAALNTANIRQGDTVAVVGCGGVGLNVIQGAKIAGAEKIIAVDMFESKLKMAEQFGATDLVKADEGDAVTNVVGLTGGRGVDVAFEVIGLGPTIEQTINMTRNGGEAILVGVPRMDVMLNLNAAFTFLYLAKTVKGCWYGSSNVREDIPKLIELYKDGELKLEELVSPRDRRRRRQRGVHRDAERRGRPQPHHPRALSAGRDEDRPPARRSSVATGSVQPDEAHQPPLSPRARRQGVREATPAGLHGEQADPELARRERAERLRRAPGGHRRGLLGGSHDERCSTRPAYRWTPAGPRPRYAPAMVEARPHASRLPAARRREQLLEVALEVFGELGFHPASMNDVAEAAGVTKPVLYQHFRSKRELYKQVLTDVGDHLLDAITKATAAAKSPHEQVELGFIAYFRFVEANEAAFRVLFGGGTRRDEEFAAQVADRRGGHRRGDRRPHRRGGAHRRAAAPARPRAGRPGRGHEPPLDGRGRPGAGRGGRPPDGRPRLARPPRPSAASEAPTRPGVGVGGRCGGPCRRRRGGARRRPRRSGGACRGPGGSRR